MKNNLIKAAFYTAAIFFLSFGVINYARQSQTVLSGSAAQGSHFLSWNIDTSLKNLSLLQLQRQDAPGWKKVSVLYQNFYPKYTGSFTNQLLNTGGTTYRLIIRSAGNKITFSNEVRLQ